MLKSAFQTFGFFLKPHDSGWNILQYGIQGERRDWPALFGNSSRPLFPRLEMQIAQNLTAAPWKPHARAIWKIFTYSFWIRAGGPTRSRGPGARARARALSTPAFQGRTSESRLFCCVNLFSTNGKVVQFLEFGNCAKSNFNPCRFREVMMKMKNQTSENHSNFSTNSIKIG